MSCFFFFSGQEFFAGLLLKKSTTTPPHTCMAWLNILCTPILVNSSKFAYTGHLLLRSLMGNPCVLLTYFPSFLNLQTSPLSAPHNPGTGSLKFVFSPQVHHHSLQAEVQAATVYICMWLWVLCVVGSQMCLLLHWSVACAIVSIKMPNTSFYFFQEEVIPNFINYLRIIVVIERAHWVLQ